MKYRDRDPSGFAAIATLIPSVPLTSVAYASLSGESGALLALQSLLDEHRADHRKTWYSFDGLACVAADRAAD